MKKQTKNNAGHVPAAAERYGRVLYELQIPEAAVQESREILKNTPVLQETLVNPVIAEGSKQKVIDRVFPKEITCFLKVICKNRRMDLVEEIFRAYERYAEGQERIIRAELVCVELPQVEQKRKMEAFLLKKYHGTGVLLAVQTDRSLLGGFVLRVGSDEYDWSLRGRLNRLEEKMTRR